ncbi:hypothetical protein HPB47_006389 [Ixodes persulcatus]|uniref:Uncharacterized protein n=1 Tax=Ixodes persulcatus TaxID=34615 RepID=A0AC60PAC9_IXOPE|nr:hypothetical protein HPB47_006389 [Ixodes persulcatus]
MLAVCHSSGVMGVKKFPPLDNETMGGGSRLVELSRTANITQSPNSDHCARTKVRARDVAATSERQGREAEPLKFSVAAPPRPGPETSDEGGSSFPRRRDGSTKSKQQAARQEPTEV